MFHREFVKNIHVVDWKDMSCTLHSFFSILKFPFHSKDTVSFIIQGLSALTLENTEIFLLSVLNQVNNKNILIFHTV